MLLTGDVLSGEETAKIGFVSKAVPPEELQEEYEFLVGRVALTDPDILAANQKSINLSAKLMGVRTMERLATELDAREHHSKASDDFGKDKDEIGFKEAPKNRVAAYGAGRVRID